MEMNFWNEGGSGAEKKIKRLNFHIWIEDCDSSNLSTSVKENNSRNCCFVCKVEMFCL